MGETAVQCASLEFPGIPHTWWNISTVSICRARDLRACTYCRKIALSYAHSADSSSIGEDLSALSDATCAVSALEPSEPRTPVGGRKASRNIFLEEDLAWQSLILQDSQPNSLATRLASMQEDVGRSPARKRSASITNLSLDRSGTSMLPYESSISPQTSRAYIKGDANEEERKILLDSMQLKDLWKKICHHSTGMEFQDHRYWLRTYPNCIVGKELVNWLLRNGHISTRHAESPLGGHDPRTAVQLRSLSTVLKRLKEIMEGKSQCPYAEPVCLIDNQLAALYRSTERTSIKSLLLPFVFVEGDLRACTYCRKIALSYAHSADSSSIGEDLSALSDATCAVSALEPSEPRTPVGGRKASRNIFLEEDLAWQRAQAIAIGQALADGRWLDCVTHHDQLFRDEYVLYRPLQSTEFSETPSPDSDSVNSLEGHSEPSWFKDIKFDDSDTEQIADEGEDNMPKSLFNRQVEEKAKELLFTPLGWHHSSLEQLREENGEKQAMERLLLCYDEKTSSFGHKYIFFIENESLFNRQVEEKAKELLFTPLGWHHSSLEQLREENGEKQAMERLLSANHSHMMALLQQLLYSESLSLSWRDIIVPVVRQVVQTVRPDVRNNDDDMDIRQCVHIPGGKKFDSAVVNGFVCTKNIAHKKMNSYIKTPKILLLKCSIEYLYREETKFTCIDPIVLQEREFLKNYVQRIVDVRPNLVLVEKTVSRIAQDMLLEHGITLVINVKPQVLDRVSRMTQGDLVMSMDQLLTKPRLGTCHKFYMHSFQLASDQSKTLMFFEGCPLHLGCTIKLRGASEYELARVKDILIFMICVAYHSQLEISFLMDEFAMPPSLAKNGSFHSLIEGGAAEAGKLDLFQGADVSTVLKELDFASEKLPAISESVSREVVDQLVDNMLLDEKVPPADEKVPDKLDEVKVDNPEMGPPHRLTLSSSSSSSSLPPAVVLPPFLMDDAEDSISQDGRLSEASTLYEGQCDGPVGLQAAPRLFRDPLQDDTGMYITELVTSSEDRLKSHSVAFKQELKDVILCISPFISFKEPFLLTQKGMRCPSRDYFHEQVYLSPLISKEFKEQDSRRKRQLLKEAPSSQPSNGSVPGRSTQVLPSHELTNTRIADHLCSSQGLSRMLADFRARGGRIRQKDADPFVQSKEASGKTGTKSESEDDRGHVQNEMAWGSKIDCLNPANHQRLCVLFSSSSAQSSNAPNPCVSPWIVTMEFYGKNDLTLGIFLERYCFSNMPSSSTLLQLPSPPEGAVEQLSSGPSFPNTSSTSDQDSSSITEGQVAVLSGHPPAAAGSARVHHREEAEPVRDAAVLEQQRVCGIAKVHCLPQRLQCLADIPHDYHQYFSYNQMVASFSYTPVRLLEVCLPPPKIYIKQQTPSKGSLFQDLKDFSQKTSVLDSSPRNASPVVQNGDKEDRYLSNMPSSSTLLQLPSPPEGAVEQLSSGPSFPNTSSTSDQDSSSITEDVFDGHLLGSTDGQVKEKSTMKAIFANLLPGNSYNPIPFPFEPDKHYLMYEHERVPIAVCEKEPSSIIAFALSCKEYKTALEELSVKGTGEEGPPPLHSTTESRAKTSSPARQVEIVTAQLNRSTDSDVPTRKTSGVLSFFRGTGGSSSDLCPVRREPMQSADTAYYQMGQSGKEGADNHGSEPPEEADGGDKHKKQLGNPHIELQFSDANAKFYCRIYYAEEFHKMREEIMESRADDFIRSLAHCVNWQARGGKSGAVFYATEDDRFILKQMPRLEVQSFLDFAPHYFTYITGAVQQKRPTALAKILGVYRIGYKNSQNNTEKKLDLLVMENLFYGRKMAQRKWLEVKSSKFTRNSSQDALGFDYIRTFTWDKKLEMVVKSTGILGGQAVDMLASHFDHKDQGIPGTQYETFRSGISPRIPPDSVLEFHVLCFLQLSASVTRPFQS
ncbi:UNVERIFIED_CONTAM: hypothetical protein FKN15_013056 [Acipenser sinensis]